MECGAGGLRSWVLQDGEGCPNLRPQRARPCAEPLPYVAVLASQVTRPGQAALAVVHRLAVLTTQNHAPVPAEFCWTWQIAVRSDLALTWDSGQGLKMTCKAVQIKLYFVYCFLLGV